MTERVRVARLFWKKAVVVRCFGIWVFGTLLFMGCGAENPEIVETPVAADSRPTAIVIDAEESEIYGIDVSDHQGIVDFERVKCADATFVFVRATQGITFRDEMYPQNAAKARAAGLVTGAYHYYMTDDEPLYQFENFISVAKLGPGDLPPVVDIETMSDNALPDLKGELQIFLDALEKHYGVKPIIYSGERFANEDLVGFGAYPLWLAEYGVDEPSLPKGWSDWGFWQYSQSDEIDGVGGAVDHSHFKGKGADLQALLIP